MFLGRSPAKNQEYVRDCETMTSFSSQVFFSLGGEDEEIDDF